MAESWGRLRERHIHAAIPAQALQVLVRIAHNADDFCRCLIDATNKEALADRVFSGRIARPKVAGEVFVDNGNPLLTFAIAFGKCAARFSGIRSV